MKALKSCDRGIAQAYQAYSIGRQTLSDLSKRTGLSISTLRPKFDQYRPNRTLPKVSSEPVDLTLDATFFGRGCGLMVYRAEGRNIHWQEIKSETLAIVEAGLIYLEEQGWRFSSVTVDSRKGAILLINRLLPDAPVQFCIFHQKAIIRRYLTAKPKTLCGKELRALTAFLGYIPEKNFADCLEDLQIRYADFLKERNDQNQFKHRRLRSAIRSLR